MFPYICTGCPEDGSNFDTPLFSGMVGHIRLIFGVFKVWMCGFNYMYRTKGLMNIRLGKYLGKIEHDEIFSF